MANPDGHTLTPFIFCHDFVILQSFWVGSRSLGVWPHLGCKATKASVVHLNPREGQASLLLGLGSGCASEQVIVGLYGKSALFRNLASPVGFNAICLQLGILLGGVRRT